MWGVHSAITILHGGLPRREGGVSDDDDDDGNDDNVKINSLTVTMVAN